jgi:hypothetical protein
VFTVVSTVRLGSPMSLKGALGGKRCPWAHVTWLKSVLALVMDPWTTGRRPLARVESVCLYKHLNSVVMDPWSLCAYIST